MQRDATVDGDSGEPPGKTSTILIAEDSESNQALFSLYLRGTGCQPVFTENGLAAVEAFKTASYDLIFMDIFMPVMGGLDAVREIRSFEQANNLPPTPIVAVSANAHTEDRERSLEAGCTDFLAKPVRKTPLLECVSRIKRG